MSKQTSSENEPKYPTSLEQLLRNTNLQREFSLGINKPSLKSRKSNQVFDYVEQR